MYIYIYIYISDEKYIVFPNSPVVFPLSALSCRFLQVHPASVEDKRLLAGIVAFLNAYFRQMRTETASTAEDKDLRWILELLLNQV